MKTSLAIVGACLLGGVLPPAHASGSVVEELKDDFQEGIKSGEWRILSNGCEVGVHDGALRIDGTVLEAGWGKGNGVVSQRALRNGGFEVSVRFMLPEFGGSKGSRLVYLQAMGASSIGLFYSPDSGYRLQDFKSSSFAGGGLKPFGDEHRAFRQLKLVCDHQLRETRGYVDGNLVGTLPVVLTGNIRFGLTASTESPGMKIDLLFDDFHAVATGLGDGMAANGATSSAGIDRPDASGAEPPKFSVAIQSKSKSDGKFPGLGENGRIREFYLESTASRVRAERQSPQDGPNEPWLKVVCVGRRAVTGELTVLHEKAVKAQGKVLEYETPRLYTVKRARNDFVLTGYHVFRRRLPSVWLGCVVLVYDAAGRVASHAEDAEGLYAALLEQFGPLDVDRNLASLDRERYPAANIKWNWFPRTTDPRTSYYNSLFLSFADEFLIFRHSASINLPSGTGVAAHPKVLAGDFVVVVDVTPYGEASAMLLPSDLASRGCSIKLESGRRRNLVVVRRGRVVQFFLDGVEVPHELSRDGFDPGGKLAWGLGGSLACRLHSLTIKEIRPNQGSFRRWSLSGEQVEAELLHVSRGQVGLRLKDGRSASVPMHLLSPRDLDYLDTKKILESFRQGEMRTWTAPNGKTVEARLVSVSADVIVLSGADGRPAEVPLKSLSREDQRYLKSEGYAIK